MPEVRLRDTAIAGDGAGRSARSGHAAFPRGLGRPGERRTAANSRAYRAQADEP